MPHFRFRLPSFFSSDAPSGAASAAATAASPRPPFRPAGVAQPQPKQPSSKRMSLETEAEAPPTVRRKSARKGVAAAASSSASPSSSRGAATLSPQQTRQSKQTVSPLKKMEPAKTEEPKADAESQTKNEIAGENAKHADEAIKEINQVKQKCKNAEEYKEQQKKKQGEKLAIQETKKVVRVDRKDATRSRIIRPVAAEIEHIRAVRDHLETKMLNRQQNNERLEIQGKDDDATNPKTTAYDPKTRSLLINSHVHPNGEGSSMSKRIKEDVKDGISKLTLGKNNQNNEEKPVTVVTLTGENRGATMQIASDKAKTDSSVHIHRGYRSNPDESPYTTATDNEEGRSFNMRKNLKEEEETLAKTYVNCNTQSINNSIVLDSSVAEHNPGAYVSVRIQELRKASGSPENAAAQKSETVVKPPEKKAAYEPRVRRRCLRGLLAESSESETENPHKPRRHGCRFSCKGKDSDAGIF